jgi:hypothetical protein
MVNRATQQTLIGLFLGILAGIGVLILPGLFAQTPPSPNSYSSTGSFPGLVNGPSYRRDTGLYNLSPASSIGGIILIALLILIVAIAVSLVTRSLVKYKATTIDPTRSNSESEQVSNENMLDPSSI